MQPPESPARSLPRRWPAAVAVAVVALAVPLWLWLRAPDTGTADDAPSAPVAAPSDAAPSDAPGTAAPGTADAPDEADEEIARIAGQIAEVRRLALRGPVDARFEPAAALVARIEELTAEQEGATGSLDSWGRLLAGIGLVPPGTDIAAALRTLYDDSVVGIYVPDEQRLYVNRSAPVTDPWTRWASAHEIVHAVQDQHFPFADLLDFAGGAVDAELAGLSLVEGDAVVTQVTWAQRFLTADERAQIDGSAPAGLTLSSQLPPYLVARFEFPYDAGPRFVSALLDHGGLDAVDEALRRPPTTSAQVLDPQRYFDGVEAVAVPMTAEAGDGWRAERHDEFGAFELRQLLGPLGGERGAAVAAGWAGGQARSWVRGPDTAVAVGVVFDSDAGARALCDALPDWWRETTGGTVGDDGVGESPEGWLAYRCDGVRVDLARAPDEQTARALVAPR